MSSPYEVDLLTLFRILWKGRTTVFLTTGIAIAIGVVVALVTPKQFTASTILVPQIQSEGSKLSGLSSLAAMAGFNLNDLSKGSQELSPLVYPQIIRSFPFQKEIMYQPLTWVEEGREMSLLEKVWKGTPPPSTLHDSILRINRAEKELSDLLSKTLTLSVDSKAGYLILTAKGPEPLATAQIADKAQKLLQSRITEFRIEKARKNLEFIQGRYDEKKMEFEAAQDSLAWFRDRNHNVVSNRARTEEDRMESRYQLALDVYTELAKQLETAKIKVKEDTPVFSVIEPVTVPVRKSKPHASIILIISTLIGGLAGVVLVFGRKNWKESKAKQLADV